MSAKDAIIIAERAIDEAVQSTSPEQQYTRLVRRTYGPEYIVVYAEWKNERSRVYGDLDPEAAHELSAELMQRIDAKTKRWYRHD